MNKLSIMQPNFLPWPGYFHLIDKVDVFIFLEKVKFEKSSWHHRNLFVINNKASFITIPVTGSRLQLINDVKINYDNLWKKKHVTTLTNNYKKHPYGSDILNLIIPILENSKFVYLKDLNKSLIINICDFLGINSNFATDKDLFTESKKSMRLIELCNIYKCKEYFSPLGSKNYIEDENLFNQFNIDVVYQNPKITNYTQFKSNNFIPYLSIIDLISNLGKIGSLEYIRKNF